MRKFVFLIAFVGLMLTSFSSSSSVKDPEPNSITKSWQCGDTGDIYVAGGWKSIVDGKWHVNVREIGGGYSDHRTFDSYWEAVHFVAFHPACP